MREQIEIKKQHVNVSESAATPKDESPAAPPRDEDSVDVECGGLGLCLQSSTDVGSTSRSRPPPPFPSGQSSASMVPAPLLS